MLKRRPLQSTQGGGPIQTQIQPQAAPPTLRRHVSKDYAALPYAEVMLYGAFLVMVMGKAFYAVYQASVDFKPFMYSFNFEKGWSIFGHRDKDMTDPEWTNWRTSFFSVGAWIMMVLYACLSRFMGYVYPKYRTLFLLGFALASILVIVGFKLLVIVLLHSLLIYAVICTGSIKAVWCILLVQIASVNFDFFLHFQRLVLSSENELYLIFFLAMCSIRHLSFAAEYHHYYSMPPAQRPDVKQYWGLQHYLLYVYYLPLFFSGPFLTYDKFAKQIHLRIHVLSLTEWKHILKELCRYLFWAMFMEIALQFFYFASFHSRSTLLNNLSAWAIGGLALCHLLYFQMKYVVMYGLPRVLAMFDHVNAPLPPVCVIGMYLFQDVWRYFDRGLHSVLVRCIYIPMGGSRSGIVWQLMASVACFSFVCFWHGTDLHLIYWAIFNCLGLQLEIVLGKLAHLTRFNDFMLKYLSGGVHRRVMALLLTPNFMCLAFSNLIFLGGHKTAYVYYKVLIADGWPFALLITTSSFYCAIQIIMTIHRIYGKDFMCKKVYYRTWYISSNSAATHHKT